MPPSRGEHLKAVFDDRKEKMYHPMHGAAFALAPSHIDEKVSSDNLWGVLGSAEEPENLGTSSTTPRRLAPPFAAPRAVLLLLPIDRLLHPPRQHAAVLSIVRMMTCR